MRGIIFSSELQKNLEITCPFGGKIDVEKWEGGYEVVLRIPYTDKESAESTADELLGRE